MVLKKAKQYDNVVQILLPGYDDIVLGVWHSVLFCNLWYIKSKWDDEQNPVLQM